MFLPRLTIAPGARKMFAHTLLSTKSAKFSRTHTRLFSYTTINIVYFVEEYTVVLLLTTQHLLYHTPISLRGQGPKGKRRVGGSACAAHLHVEADSLGSRRRRRRRFITPEESVLWPVVGTEGLKRLPGRRRNRTVEPRQQKRRVCALHACVFTMGMYI